MAEDKQFDVCLLLEGTYPFVAGGVSEWAHHLVENLSDLSFTGISIVPTLKESQDPKYDLPDNFHDLKVVTLYEDSPDFESRTDKRNRRKQMKILEDFHRKLKDDNYAAFGDVLELFRKDGLTLHDMLHSREAWDFLVNLYNPEENEESFIDYFWTFRITHMPFFKILKTGIPKAKVYHAISTGYAGLVGSMAKQLTGSPFLITEHGIYTRERKIDIMQTEWIYDPQRSAHRIRRTPGQFQRLWIELFERMGKIAYHSADGILTVCEGNRRQQIAQGADPKRSRVVHNGIDVDRFSGIFEGKRQNGWNHQRTPAIGFVGRVVPIKDIKTFIRACRIVKLRYPDMKIYILGPTDEDPAYYRECVDLANTLDLGDAITFTGNVTVEDYFPRLDVIVLTSISEAQPLIILEANCAGIPVVATDVGGCREMLEGIEREDREIGPSGMVTGIADPDGTASAISTLLGDNGLRKKMGEAGNTRARTFYREEDLHRKYHEIYMDLIGRKD